MLALLLLLLSSLAHARPPHDFKHNVVLLGRKSHASNTFQIQFEPSDALSLKLKDGVKVGGRVVPTVADDVGDPTSKDKLITTKMNISASGFGDILFAGPPVNLTVFNKLSYYFVYNIEGQHEPVITQTFSFDPNPYLLPQVHSDLVGGFKDDDNQFVYKLKAEITEELNREVSAMKVVLTVNKAHDSSEMNMITAHDLMETEDGFVPLLSEEGIMLTSGDTVTYYFTYLASKELPLD